MKRILTASAGLALLIASPIHATTINFYTEGVLSSTTSYGNNLTHTEDGVTVTVTGWSVADNLSGSYSNALLKKWDTGLGMCNSGQQPNQGNCGTGPHATDNIKRDEVFLLTFSVPVLVTEAVITAWASDYDAAFWGSPDVLTLTTFAALDALGRYTSEVPSNATAGSSWRPVSLESLESPVRSLVFGVMPGQDDDKFKFKSVSFLVPEEDTPEPGTLLLVGIGAALLAVRSRNRRQA